MYSFMDYEIMDLKECAVMTASECYLDVKQYYQKTSRGEFIGLIPPITSCITFKSFLVVS